MFRSRLAAILAIAVRPEPGRRMPNLPDSEIAGVMLTNSNGLRLLERLGRSQSVDRTAETVCLERNGS